MFSGRTHTLVAAGLILLSLLARGALLAGASFYWDDLILIGRTTEQPILSWAYLGERYDGHFMPLAFLVVGLTTAVAPLEWWLPAATLLLGQLLAALAVWRMIRIVAPSARGGALAAFAFYLFTPMTLPSFAWWAAGLNTLPLQAGLAWIVGDAVLAARPDAGAGRRSVRWLRHDSVSAKPIGVAGTESSRDDEGVAVRRRWIALRSTLVFVLALGFFEKSVVILPVALVATLLAAAPGTRRWRRSRLPLRRLLRAAVRPLQRTRLLWAGLISVTVVWAIIVLPGSAAAPRWGSAEWDAAQGTDVVDRDPGQTLGLTWDSIRDGVVPALAGGPWRWERWATTPPFGDPSVWLQAAGWLVVVVAVLAAVRRGPRGLLIVTCAAAYVLAIQAPVYWLRSAQTTTAELADTLRYLPDTALVLTLAFALLLAGRPSTEPVPQRSGRTIAAMSATAALVVSSLIGGAGFTAAWWDDPTGPYLDTAVAHLAVDTTTPLLPQPVPIEILSPVVYPANRTDLVFGPVRRRPPFGDVTDRLRVFDLDGRLVPGAVLPLRDVAASPDFCQTPDITGPIDLALSQDTLDWEWTLELPYCAATDGELDISIGEGEAVRVPVTAGAHTVYVRLAGGGDELHLRSLTPGLRLHVGGGRLGEAVDARYLR